MPSDPGGNHVGTRSTSDVRAIAALPLAERMAEEFAEEMRRAGLA